MAAKKKRKTTGRSRSKRRPTPRQGRRGGLGQRLLVGVAGMVLVLCAASITQGFFYRNGKDRPPVPDQFRVEVLNGTGKQGLAHAVRRCLHRKGIDVIDARNAKSFDYEETVLMARRPGADVDQLGELLGCSNIVIQYKDNSLADATLILGADYRGLELDWHLESDLLK
jgi:hypothetical protein